MVAALDLKLVRNLKHLRGQVITISLVVACGIASFILMQSTYQSLEASREHYYERYRFSDIFATLKRAPESTSASISAIDGVSLVETRLVEPVTIPISSMIEAANGALVSLPDVGHPVLNDVCLRAGRLPERPNEVLLLEPFARAHGLRPLDRLPAVINGKLRQLLIVGTALSPEFVFNASPGDVTVNDRLFAVLWMQRNAIAPAFQMDGAFNSIAVKLEPGKSPDTVLERIDAVLSPYGGAGAIPRARQLSNFAINGELTQLSTMATVIPSIFLGVAAFLLNVVLARLVSLERPEIATLKAVGYSDRQIATHYLKLVIVIVLLGAALGLWGGAWLAENMLAFYGRFFKFPELEYNLSGALVGWSVFISLGAAVLGALGTARHIARLPPAEAMRPAAPDIYRRTIVERLGLYRFLGPVGRMIAREVERKPLRTLISSSGIAMATAIVVVGQFWNDATDFLIDVQFRRAMREDLSVSFFDPQPARALRALAHLPGVLHVEGQRTVPVRIHHASRYRDIALIGLQEPQELRKVLDQHGSVVSVPEHGVLLTQTLANILEVSTGDVVEVELREGKRRTVHIPVTGTVDESFGLQGYLRLDELHDILRERDNVTFALLRIDPTQYAEIHRRLKKMKAIAGVTRRDNVAERFQQQSGDMMQITTFILTLFAAAIAVGVIYNNARIALSVRGRDLASLRVLGFTKGEVASILIGELSVELFIGIPLGLLWGTWLSHAMMSMVDPETYRFAVIISPRTYGVAAMCTSAAGVLSALLVRRRLNQLDLISVLKTRE